MSGSELSGQSSRSLISRCSESDRQGPKADPDQNLLAVGSESGLAVRVRVQNQSDSDSV